MISKFTRTWTNWERLFPRVQSPPAYVSDTVVGVHDVMRNFFMAGGRLRAYQNTDALVAGVNNLLLPEPPAGVIQFPMVLACVNPDAASRDMIVLVTPTASTPDPWGPWFTGSGLITQHMTNITAGRTAQLRAVPMVRGSQLTVRMQTMTGGNNAVVNYLCAEVPGELCTLSDWTAYAGAGNL